jgi:hypothetical protein
MGGGSDQRRCQQIAVWRAKLCLNNVMDGYLLEFRRRFYFESEGFILLRSDFCGYWLSDIVLYKFAAKSSYLIEQYRVQFWLFYWVLGASHLCNAQPIRRLGDDWSTPKDSPPFGEAGDLYITSSCH